MSAEQHYTTAIIRLAFARTHPGYVYHGLTENDKRAVKLDSVPPVVFSEAASEVRSFAAAGQYDAGWERKVDIR